MISTLDASLLFAPLALAAVDVAGIVVGPKLVDRIEVFATAAAGVQIALAEVFAAGIAV